MGEAYLRPDTNALLKKKVRMEDVLEAWESATYYMPSHWRKWN